MEKAVGHRNAFLDKYRAALGAVVFILLSFCANAQIFQYPNPGTFGTGGHRGDHDSVVYLPTQCGAPTGIADLHSSGFNGFGQKIKRIAILGDTCGHHVYWWDPSNSTWSRLDGGGAGTDSAIARGSFTVKNSVGTTIIIDIDTAALHGFFVRLSDSGIVFATPTQLASKQNQISGTGYGKWLGQTVTFLTPAQVTSDLNQFTTTLQGLVPPPGTTSGNALTDNGTWQAFLRPGDSTTYATFKRLYKTMDSLNFLLLHWADTSGSISTRAYRQKLADSLVALMIKNNGGSTGIKAGAYLSRPAASNCQCYYWSTDSAFWSYDNSVWKDLKPGSGTGTTVSLTATGSPMGKPTLVSGALNIPPSYAINITDPPFNCVADCNGTSGNGTDNTAGLQRAIDSCNANGCAIFIPSPPKGSSGKGYRFSSTLNLKGKNIEFYGYGKNQLTFYQLTGTVYNGASRLLFDNATANSMVIDSSSTNQYPTVKLHDFGLTNIASGRATAGAGIVFKSNNQQSYVINVSVEKFFIGIDQQSANLITFDNDFVLYSIQYGVHCGNYVSNDFGGIKIINCAILSDSISSPACTAIGLYVTGSGAIEMSGTTISGLYHNYPSQFLYAIKMDYSDGASSDIDIHDCWFENMQNGVLYAINRSAGGTLANLNIHDCEMKMFNPSAANFNLIYINNYTAISIDALVMGAGASTNNAAIRIDSSINISIGSVFTLLDYAVIDSITNSTGVNHALSTNSILASKPLDFGSSAGIHDQLFYAAGKDSWGARFYIYPKQPDSCDLYISPKGTGKIGSLTVSGLDAPANVGNASVGKFWNDNTNVNLSSINNGGGQIPLRIGFGTTPTALVFNTDGTITPGATFQGLTLGSSGNFTAYSGIYSTTNYHARVSDLYLQGVAADNMVFSHNAKYASGWNRPTTGYAAGVNLYLGQWCFFANPSASAGALTPQFVAKIGSDGWSVLGSTTIDVTAGAHTGGTVVASPDSVMLYKLGTGTTAMPVVVWNTSSKRMDTVAQSSLVGAPFSFGTVTATGGVSMSTAYNNILYIDATAGNVTMTITFATTNQNIRIKRKDNTASTVAIQLNTGNIDGVATKTMAGLGSMSLTYDGTNAWIF